MLGKLLPNFAIALSHNVGADSFPIAFFIAYDCMAQPASTAEPAIKRVTLPHAWLPSEIHSRKSHSAGRPSAQLGQHFEAHHRS